MIDSLSHSLVNELTSLALSLDGDLHFGSLMRKIYATDASAFQQFPLAVAIPKSDSDIQKLIAFASEHQTSLIPRAAGTSLAGQVVGSGIVVDISVHFDKILEINAEEKSVRCQPGVIRNELNMALKPFGLLFGPETSTQNRAMIGGMIGNNSCGSNSIKYGSTREYLMEVKGFLSDGSPVVFKDLSKAAFNEKCEQKTLEGKIYSTINEILSSEENRVEISREFPHPDIKRRNTGYALDMIMESNAFNPEIEKPFNFCQLIAGSEGTLCFITEVNLRCLDLPPAVSGLQCAQFNSVQEALKATLIATEYDAYAVEIIDHYILECTERSIEHRNNRFFLEGQPAAVLVTELRGESREEVKTIFDDMESRMREAKVGYTYPVLYGEDCNKIWNLRKAGLGLLGNIPDDAKPVPVIEDTAVRVSDLPEYIHELTSELKNKYNLECVHYAHAGSGEIHLRPIINLKTKEGNALFRKVAITTSQIVKKYRGSLSGEHGDGRLRGEFLKDMIGPHNYELIRAVKQSWDPEAIFNPGKIVDTPAMNTSLRYTPGQQNGVFETVFDWSANNGILGAAEMCNGSGDCRKTHLSGGTMCPSYMATRNEKDTTRARANILRQAMSAASPSNKKLPVSKEAMEVLDLCLSCKGCKTECPSTVDVAKLKAEFTQRYYEANRIPLRSRIVANFSRLQKVANFLPSVSNLFLQTPALRKTINKLIGFHPERSIPAIPSKTLRNWYAKHTPHTDAGIKGKLILFCDEFTNFSDPHVGIKAVRLLEHLGYEVKLVDHRESGRTWLSKGMVKSAQKHIQYNVRTLAPICSIETPLVGLEPSAILTFRDEALDLSTERDRENAIKLAEASLTLEEFINRESAKGRISPDAFTEEDAEIHLHAHCYQKALGSTQATVNALNLPLNYKVKVIPSGCCGMAGSFGYEKEHYELSQKIGNLVLFPAARAAASEKHIIAAPGTSCRHQIKDGTNTEALHPAEILYNALR